mgnify:CR=1 FL=1
MGERRRRRGRDGRMGGRGGGEGRILAPERGWLDLVTCLAGREAGGVDVQRVSLAPPAREAVRQRGLSE